MNAAQIANRMRGLFRFARIISSTQSEAKTVGVKIELPDGQAGADDNEVWSGAPLLFRPAAPSIEGKCEALCFDIGDRKVVIATKERRWQLSTADGEVIMRAMGPGAPAYVHLKPDGSAIINATSINLGGAALQFVALANLVLAELGDIRTKFDAHVHTTTATIGTGGPGAISVPTALMGAPGSVAATKTKAE